MLKQECGHDEHQSVLLHPWQLRAVCEEFGVIATDGAAHKTIATLTRRLLALQGRIGFLADYLANHSDHKHADLSYETTYARATADIADEFCAELSEAEPMEDATGNADAPVDTQRQASLI